jgi:hypothetical protein
MVNFKKNLDRSVREYDTRVRDGETGGLSGEKERTENAKDHGGRLLRGRMIAYEFKGGYYVIKKAGDLRKREREKWGIITEKEYGEIMARKKHLDEKRAENGGTEGSGSNREKEGPTIKSWKPGDKVLDENGEEKIGELGISVPVDGKDGDFDIIEKVNLVLDGGNGRRADPTSWDIDEVEESLESDESHGRGKNILHLVDKLETKAFKAVKKKQKQVKNDFPKTVAEAMKRSDWEQWKEAIKKEMMSIVKMGTFRDLQSKKDWRGKALRTKIVVAIKCHTDGSIKSD